MGEPADEDNKRPSGIPPRASEKRRVSLRPPGKSDPPPERRDPTPTHAVPPGLGHMSTTARQRLELALDVDSAELEVDDEGDDDEVREEAPVDQAPRRRERTKTPMGLKNMTTSARHRLELAVEHDDDDVFDPKKPPTLPKERLSDVDLRIGTIPFDDEGQKIIRSLAGWIGFCGVITLGIGALTGLSYVTGEGSVAHVVVGILATAISFWQLMAVWSLRKVITERRQQHHMVHALGHIRSALLLKALLVCAAMVLGCFTFSIAGSLLFLLG